MKTVLISCVAKKKGHKCKARELYDSTWFKLALRYAETLNPDRIFVLSAKHGLVDVDSVIAPYEETLNTKPANQIEVWGQMVLKQLKSIADVENDDFIILAGEAYRKYLVKDLPNHSVPMEGLRIGEQLRWLKKNSAK